MKEVESLAIKYIGFREPMTEDEVELEMLGLKTAIAAAEQRIAVLKQSVKLQEIMKKSIAEETVNETISKTGKDNKAE